MNEGNELPEREKTVFEPKAVVANSARPKQVNTWARQFIGWAMRAAMEKMAAQAAIATVKRLPPTAEERAEFARIYRERAVYGRRGAGGHSWWPWQRRERDPNYNGEREICRRRLQIERGQLHPIYRE